jgi:hypothetical protein
VEFPEVLVICGLLGATALYAAGWGRRIAQAMLLIKLALLAFGVLRAYREGVVVLARSFYGSLWVWQGPVNRALYHGSTRHGLQIFLTDYVDLPTTYYGPQSGVGIVLKTRTSPRRVGVVGLGVGTLAAYGKPGDSFEFCEIDPNVARLANTQFSYLKSSHAAIDIAIGDGRLLLNREGSQQFDLLAVDAFSGDAIPTHLLTREAFELYLRVIKPGGLLAVHITNAFLDLRPVLARAAEAMKVQAVFIHSERGCSVGADPSDWVILSADANALQVFTQSKCVPLPTPPSDFRLWTDDYSNLLRLLK